MLEIREKKIVSVSRWTRFVEKGYLDTAGNHKQWTYIERIGDTRAVVVIARTEGMDEVLLIKQFRVPLEATVVEFPAGLIDIGENPEQAALRELEEETGYRGEVLSVSGPLCTSPGLTTELIHQVAVRCREIPEQGQALESSEVIEVVRVPARELADYIHQCGEEGVIVDSRVAAYALTQVF